MLFDLAALWLVVWMCKTAAMDVSCAVTGKPNPRYELKKARARASGLTAPAQPRYGTRDWLADLYSDGLRAQTEWRRRRRRAAAKHETGQPAKPATTPAVAAGPPLSVATGPAPVDPDQPQNQPPDQPQNQPPAPAPIPVPVPQTVAEQRPDARIIPFPNTFKEDTVSTTVNGEIVGLDQSIAYAKSLAAFAGEHGLAGNEGYLGHLAESKVTGAGLQTAHDMQEAFSNAQAAAERHATELEKQRTVQEAYDSTPDAGDKDFQQQGPLTSPILKAGRAERSPRPAWLPGCPPSAMEVPTVTTTTDLDEPAHAAPAAPASTGPGTAPAAAALDPDAAGVAPAVDPDALAVDPAVDPDALAVALSVDAGLRRQLAPWAAMGALVLAAAAARIAMHATGEDAEVAYGIAATAFTIAVVAAWATRRRSISRKLRHRLVAALYLGAAWLSTVTMTGMSLGAVAALTIVGAGLSLLWWREHRIGPGPFAKPTALAGLGDDDLYITRWATHLGGKGKQLAGSTLTEPQIIKAGYRYVLELVPGRQTVEQVRTMVGALRGGLRLLPGQDVIVEVHPERPAPTAVLTIVTRPPVRTPRLWPGPEAGFDPATGSVNLGPFVDGEGIAQWSVYKKDGIFGGYLQGAPGSGKSRMLESIAMSLAACQTHPTVVWYGDGQHGDSSPMLVEHADYAATSFEAIYNMLQAAVRIMKINGVENRLAKTVGFHPTPERPGLVVFLDECHKPLDENQNPLLAAACQSLCLTIAREGRKVGVGLVMASQSSTLDAFGGSGNGAETLRASLLAGNGVILRGKSKNTKQVFEVDINPSMFPKLPGYAYLCDPEEGARSAPLRGFWVTDEMALTWPQRIAWRSLPARQANAAGKHYARRHELAAEQAMADALLLQLTDAGMLDELEALHQQVAANSGPAPDVDVIEVGGDMHPPIRRVARFWTAAGDRSIQQRRQTAALSPGQQKVVNAITAGRTSPKEIAETTGYSSSQTFNLLGELTALGRITKAGYGRYQTRAAAA